MKLSLNKLNSFVFKIARNLSLRSNALNEVKPQITSKKYLILTADDYGVSNNVNEGIEFAAKNELITAIEVMANFRHCLPRLKRLSEEKPNIGIGLHLNITTGKPLLTSTKVPTLVNKHGNFYTLDNLLPVANKVNLNELKNELKAQIEAAREAGIPFNHFSNQHNILSLYSPFFDIVLELATEYKVALRTTLVGSAKYPTIYPNAQSKKEGKRVAISFIIAAPFKAINFLKYGKIEEMARNESKMNTLGISHPDLLIDYFYGDPTTQNLFHILNTLPDGINELALHLGTNTREDTYPTGLDVDYFQHREFELATFTSYNIQDHIIKNNIQIIGFQDIDALQSTKVFIS